MSFKLLFFSGGIVLSSMAVSATHLNSKLSLESFVASDCEPVQAYINDWAVCPKVVSYQFPELTLQKAKFFLETELHLSLQSVSRSEGIREIIESLNTHAEALKAHSADLQILAEQEAAKRFQVFARLFSRKLNRSSRGKLVYIDFSTEWAPSVEAKALVLIDLKNDRLEVVYHGLNDG